MTFPHIKLPIAQETSQGQREGMARIPMVNKEHCCMITGQWALRPLNYSVNTHKAMQWALLSKIMKKMQEIVSEGILT